MAKFGEVIDEIGIDVGLDQNQKIWMYEVNWRRLSSCLLLGIRCGHPFHPLCDVSCQKSKTAQKENCPTKTKQVEAKKTLPIIAITGSAGKTTTKAFVGSILSKKWNVFESKDYWNTTEHTKSIRKKSMIHIRPLY